MFLLLLAALGIGVGVVAGATVYALTGPGYWYPMPYSGYGYWYRPAFYAGPRLYYTAAW